MTMTELNYGLMMQRALRSVMAEALSVVVDGGLPGDHHFYITINTRHPDTDLPDWLRADYPDQITIVLQFEFADLEVTDQGFGVSMSFNDRHAHIYAPFDAVLTFVDPSVEFGLKFDATEIDIEDEAAEPEPEPKDNQGDGAEVVSLDQFRKT